MPGSLSPTKRSNKWSIHICTCLSVMTYFKNTYMSTKIHIHNTNINVQPYFTPQTWEQIPTGIYKASVYN